MKECIVNKEISISCPEGFHEMDKEELKQLYLDDNPDRFGLRDPDRHIIVSVWWHISSPLLVKLAGNAKDVAKSTEAKLRKGHKHNQYSSGDFFPVEIDGHTACGFRYEYTVNDIKQAARAIVLLHGNCCYTIYFYERKENEAANEELLKNIQESIRFVS